MARSWLFACMAAALLAAGGCVSQDKAILMAPGSYGDVAIVTSTNELAGALDPFLAEFNQEYNFVLQHELRFNIDVYDPARWDLCKGYKNVILAIEPSRGGKVVDVVRDLVSERDFTRLLDGSQPVMYLEEPFANYQFAVIVAGPDRNSVVSQLRRGAPELREMIEAKSVERINRRYRHDGLRTELMTRLWNRDRFYLAVPVDYELNQDHPGGYTGIELMQTGPSRGLTVAWQSVPDPTAALADTARLLQLREEVGRRMHDEILVPGSARWLADTVGGLPAVRLEGAWDSTAFAGGGAFWCWFVADPAGGRLFCLDALCFAPGMDKMDFFRRMRAVLQTFSLERPTA